MPTKTGHHERILRSRLIRIPMTNSTASSVRDVGHLLTSGRAVGRRLLDAVVRPRGTDSVAVLVVPTSWIVLLSTWTVALSTYAVKGGRTMRISELPVDVDAVDEVLPAAKAAAARSSVSSG